MTPPAVIRYEFPVTERVRTMLRIDNLYRRLVHFQHGDNEFDLHAALLLLFDLMEVAGRADLKSDLLQELDRQRLWLKKLAQNPGINQEGLCRLIEQIQRMHEVLLRPDGRFAQHIRDNEWLMTIRQRAMVPGGMCVFDLPSYHYWQHRPLEERKAEVAHWLAPLLPVCDAVCMILRLLRESARSFALTACKGAFQQMLGGKSVQLLIVELGSGIGYVPELSANRYAINIRFLVPGNDSLRAQQSEDDVAFSLDFCNLSA